jgi:hypothetical protein
MADKGMYNLLIDIRANIASLQKDMDSAQGILKRATTGFGSTMRGFFEGIGQELAKGALRNITELSRAISGLADKGDRLGDIADNFKSLGGSADSIKRAQQAVLGTVNAFDLMQAANSGLLRGIPNLNERFADLAKYANQFANATGQETVPVLNELIEAVGSGKAEALRKFGFELGETSGKAENSAKAFEQLNTRISEMGELGTSVTQSHQAMSSAISEAVGQISIAINENQQLAQIYNDVGEAIRSIDWKAVGSDIASMIASVASVLPSLQTVASEVNKVALGLRYLSGNLTPMEQNLKKINDLEGKLKEVQELGKNDFANWLFDGAYQKQEADLKRQLESAKRAARNLMDNDGLQNFIDNLPTPGGGSGSTSTNPALRAQQNAFAFERRLADERAKKSKDNTDKEKEERLKALEDYNDEAMRLTSQAISAEFEARQNKMSDWTQSFADLFSGTILGLSPVFAELAGSFAESIGGALSDLFGGGGSSGGGIFDFLGSNLSTSDAHAAGIQGPGLPDGSFGGSGSGGMSAADIQQIAQMAFNIYSAFRGSDKINAANNDNSGTGAAIGQLFLGGQFGSEIGKAIGGLFGRGPQNKETQGRHTFANYMEDRLRDMGGLTVRDGAGGSSRLTNFMEGSSGRFNDGKWANTLNSQAKEVKQTFSGLGEAFKEILGITEDVGGQIGFLLGENLKFNVDNARMLVKRLGLSFEEIEKQLVETGLKGERTWLEIESDIQGVAEAFKPGLAAVGAFGQAMDNLLGSGARGFEAVQSIRDIAVEAAEAGIKNFDQLRQELAKTFDPATIDAFFKALQQRGVTSIGELMQLSDRAAGGIVADMQALGVKFTDTGKKIGDSISANTSSTEANTSALNANTKALGGKAVEPPEADLEVDGEFARGGVITGPTRALMGEAGPEAVLPLTRRNGKLGVAMFGNIGASGTGGGGYAIHIDARGAAPGVEKSIRSAIRNSERRVLESIGRSSSRRSRRTT